jgi:Co/Zn/Cd efflux system component
VAAEEVDVRHLRRIVLTVALINFAYFFVEFAVALTAGSVSLLADSVDFLEDTAVNLLVFAALGWPLAGRALLGKAMTLVILVPAALAGWQAIQRFGDPQAPHVGPLVLASLGAIAVNGMAAWLLAKVVTTAARSVGQPSCRPGTMYSSTSRSSPWVS